MKLLNRFFFTKNQPQALPETGVIVRIFPYLVGLFLILFVLFLISLYKRGLHIDEAILGEQIFWLVKEGIVRSRLYAGIGTGLEDKLLVYHKFFIWLGAGLVYIFGLSLTLLRLLSLISAILLCYLLYHYHSRYQLLSQPAVRQTFFLSLLFLLSNSHFFAFSFIFRPEVMQACLGFGSFYLLAQYLKKRKQSNLLFAGLLAGLAALTHLNGLIFVSAGVLLLLGQKELKATLVFGVVATFTTGFYLIDMLAPGELEKFFIQFGGAPAYKEGDLHPLNRFLRVLEEHKRYFNAPMEGSFSILLILIVAVRFQYLWKRHALLMRYTLFAGLSLAVINQGQTSKYALLLLPFAAVLMADGFRSILASRPRPAITFTLLFSVYFCIQLYSVHSLFSNRLDIVSRNEAISRHIPEGSRVYASASFLFNQIENYQLRSLQTYATLVHRFNRLDINREDFFEHARAMGSEYVLLDLFYVDHDFYDGIIGEKGLQPEETYYGYKVMQAKDNYVILKRQD